MPMSTKRKAPAKLAAPVVRSSAKPLTTSTVDETRASISGVDALHGSQVTTIEISSDSDSEEDLSDDEHGDEAEQLNGKEQAAKPAAPLARVNGEPAGHDAAEPEVLSDGEPTSPSFGELLRDTEAIDVPALVQQSGTESNTAVQQQRKAIVPPSHQSLTTVVSQALRTDDVDLFESCLRITDLTTIRNTIERIDSNLAKNLLTKLAARLHRRPGRAGTLMTWVQWSLVAHGGTLTSQSKLVHSLNSLQKVMSDRTMGVNSLLALKGKLDLLDGQMALRKKMQRGSLLLGPGEADDKDDDLVWVEGETDAANDKDLANGIGSRRKGNVEDSDNDDKEAPVTNGFVGDSEDEEGDSDVVHKDDDGDSADAEEPLDEDEVDHDDVDESAGEDEESDFEAAAPPPKVRKVARGSFPKRK